MQISIIIVQICIPEPHTQRFCIKKRVVFAGHASVIRSTLMRRNTNTSIFVNVLLKGCASILILSYICDAKVLFYSTIHGACVPAHTHTHTQANHIMSYTLYFEQTT